MTFAAGQEGGSPIAFWAWEKGQGCLIPLLRRLIPAHLQAPDDWTDATSPYGYPSPLFTHPFDSEGVARLLSRFRTVGCESHLITAFLRLHPLLYLPLEALRPHGDLVKHGRTVWIDLSLPRDVQQAQVRSGHRADLKKLRRAGFTAHIDDWTDYPDFGEMYRSTMKRVGASQYYLFSDAYFAGLRSALGSHFHLCTVRDGNGEFAAGGLFTVLGGIVEYHLSGTSEFYVRQAPTKLLLDTFREWAANTGNALFHLGGGLGGKEDSLFTFKAGFSPLRSDFYSFRMILESYGFDRLMHRSRNHPEHTQCTEKDEFFPPYRRAHVLNSAHKEA